MTEKLGDKLGPRIAALIGQYTLAARRDHAPIEARIRQVATQALIDKAGHEFADHIGPLIEKAIDVNPDMDATVKDYLLRTASGRHQLQAVAGHIAMAGAGSVLSTILSNELGPAAYAIIGSNPNLRLDQSTVATLAQQGIISAGQAYREGAEQGYDNDRMSWLLEAAFAIPDSATVGQMVNRGLIPQATVDYLMNRGGYPDSVIPALLALREDVLAPADAALAVLRSEMSQAAGTAKAALSGVSAADFETLVLNTGEPPGAESLMEALRRGFVDAARFTHGIEQSRIRNEWIDVMLALRFSPMSIADAVNGVVQNHLTAAQAAQIAEQNGLIAGQVDTLIANAGEPLSRTELEQLYNRGLVDLPTVEQGLRESRLKDKYITDAVELHVRLPEPRQVVSGIRYGAISTEQGASLLTQYGFSPDTAALLIATGLAEKNGAAKDLTVSEIRTIYIDGIFSAETAQNHLTLLGYDATEAGYLLASWNLAAQAAVTRQAVGAIRSRYVARKLDWPAAQADLVALGIPETAIAQYQNVWGIEQSARIATLTEAQVVHAVKVDLMSETDARDRLEVMGYSADDAHILLGKLPGAALSQAIGGTSGT